MKAVLAKVGQLQSYVSGLSVAATQSFAALQRMKETGYTASLM